MAPRRHSIRTLASLAVSVSLLASSLAATVVGATAKIDVGGGPTVTTGIVSGATPSVVSPNNVAGFYLWAHNVDNANLASFFLTASTSATPIGAYWSHNSNAGPYTACTIDGGLSCDFGAFNSDQAVYIVAAFKLPSGTSTSHKNCIDEKSSPPANSFGIDPNDIDSSTWVCMDFQFGSNSGYVPGKNKSRGDAYHWFDVVGTTFDNGNTDSAAQFPFCNKAVEGACNSSPLLTIFDVKNLGKNNPQWTEVVAPPGALSSQHGTTALYVADNVAFDCFTVTGLADCANATLGQWSQIDVNSGGFFPDEWIKISNGIYGVNANKITAVYHFYHDANGWHLEKIDGVCPDANGPATTSSPACFWVQGLQGNAAEVFYWTHHNGFGKYG